MTHWQHAEGSVSHRVSCACLYMQIHSICDAAAPVSSADTWAPYHTATHSWSIHSTELPSVAVVARLLDSSDYNAAEETVQGTQAEEEEPERIRYSTEAQAEATIKTCNSLSFLVPCKIAVTAEMELQSTGRHSGVRAYIHRTAPARAAERCLDSAGVH